MYATYQHNSMFVSASAQHLGHYPVFYPNATVMTSASNMIVDHLHYNNSNVNSTVFDSSSSPEPSSSTSLISSDENKRLRLPISDENSPTSISSTTNHHNSQLSRVAFHLTESTENIPYPPFTATTTSTLRLKKRERVTVPVEDKDMNYWDKRRKNNESAKKSRDHKREKEFQMLGRIGCLESENIQLKARMDFLNEENNSLKALLNPNSN